MDPVSVLAFGVVALFWAVVSVQDLRTRLISPVFLYLMLPASVFYLDFGPGFLAVVFSYLIFAEWAWVTEGVSRGDVTMLFVYGITTANTPVTGLQALLLTAGSTIIAAEHLLDVDDIPFAPVFLFSYLVTQATFLLIQT